EKKLGRVTHRGSADGAQLPGSQRAQRVVEGLILQSAVRAERALSLVRLSLVLAVAARFIWLDELHSPDGLRRATLELPVLMVSILCSVWFVFWTRRPTTAAPGLLLGSVLLDAGIACLTLLPGVLSPWATYQGLLRIPDVAVLPVLCLATGLRMSAACSILGALVHGASFAALVLADMHMNAARIAYESHEAGLYFAYLCAASLLGLVVTVRGKALARAAALQSMRADRARGGLTRALQNQHDAGSLLSAALIHADLIQRGTHDGDASLHGSAVAMKQNLEALSKFVSSQRDQAYLGLAASDAMDGVSVAEVAHVLIGALRPRFPGIAFSFAEDQAATCVRIVGGARGLERVLLNLLINAAEGDGTHGALRVQIHAEQRATRVRLSISDDGPGFPAHVLQSRSERFVSTKQSGSGLGLTLIESVIHASGGSFVLCNHGAGARVTVDLLAAID
ncbi:MAG: hypothetical protein RL385_5481, partial [Pseudomonadota bacterium]